MPKKIKNEGEFVKKCLKAEEELIAEGTIPKKYNSFDRDVLAEFAVKINMKPREETFDKLKRVFFKSRVSTPKILI